MPVGLRRFLFSKDFSDADAHLATNYQLKPEQVETLGDVVMDTIFNDLSLAEGIEEIKKAVSPEPIAEERWKAFVTDLVRLEFWPIRDLFGEELSFWLAEQQIGTGGWPTSRVLLKPLTYSAAATELSQRAGFSLMGPQLRERLRDLIVSKIKGVRIDAQIRETLMRQQDFGGLGLDAKQADATIFSLNDILQSVDVMSEADFADWLAEETRKARGEGEETLAQTDEASTDDPEIAAIKNKMQSLPKAPPTVLDQAVQKALDSLPNKPTDAYILRRLQNVISSRLRDVRNQLELRQILLRDSKVGGVGLLPDQADMVISKVEEAYQVSHASIMEDEKKKLDDQLAIQQQKIEERKKREAEEHAKWYQEKILAKKQAEERQTQATEQFRKQFISSTTTAVQTQQAIAPVDVKEQQREQQRFGQMVPAAAMGASMPQETAHSAGVIAHPEVKVSVATAKLQDQTPMMQKPRLDGVVVPPSAPKSPMSAFDASSGQQGGVRLVGLMGELSELTLTEFRRMAKTPEEAVMKILQKLDTLAQESFERRVEGVRAFQASPLQGAYMTLVAESFRAGKPVASLAEEKRAKGENTLSPTEIASIISLNSKLHF